MPYVALLKSVVRCLTQGMVSRAAVLTQAQMSPFLTTPPHTHTHTHSQQKPNTANIKQTLPLVFGWNVSHYVGVCCLLYQIVSALWVETMSFWINPPTGLVNQHKQRNAY